MRVATAHWRTRIEQLEPMKNQSVVTMNWRPYCVASSTCSICRPTWRCIEDLRRYPSHLGTFREPFQLIVLTSILCDLYLQRIYWILDASFLLWCQAGPLPGWLCTRSLTSYQCIQCGRKAIQSLTKVDQRNKTLCVWLMPQLFRSWIIFGLWLMM